MTGKNLPRSIRNNNPFNIKFSQHTWIGKVPADKNTDFKRTFEQFQSMYFGARAGMKLILEYMLKYGLKDIKSILNRFAPSSENYTNRYIDFVTRNNRNEKVYQDSEKITTLDMFLHVCARICKFESGASANVLENFFLDVHGLHHVYDTYFRGTKYDTLFTNFKKS